MRFNGKTVDRPQPRLIIIPREDGDIVFKAGAVTDYKPFDKLVPRPVAPLVTERGKKPYHNENSKEYLRALDVYANLKTAWLVLTSLSATEGLEWETVDLDEPDTWQKYTDELETGFADFEMAHIINSVFGANSMDEDRSKEAKERFMSSQAEAEDNTISQKDELVNTPSGEPAND